MNDGAADGAMHPAVKLCARKRRFYRPPHATLRTGRPEEALRVLVQIHGIPLHARADEGVAVGVTRLRVDET